jgi:hypothetical protein
MAATHRPNREEFIAFWRDFDRVSWRDFMPYVIYLGPLVMYAFVIRRFDPEGRLALLSVVLALGYVILFPCITIRGYHRRYARFLRCPSCGDWFGQDASGAYHGPNPRFRGVIETGCCPGCGEPILFDREGRSL